jgi:hypothetical protein
MSQSMSREMATPVTLTTPIWPRVFIRIFAVRASLSQSGPDAQIALRE